MMLRSEAETNVSFVSGLAQAYLVVTSCSQYVASLRRILDAAQCRKGLVPAVV